VAHQWSGDLVTTAWWNDIWLNEAFATWMSSRILAEWQPDWNTRLSDLQSKFGAMGSDSLVTARQIRQPIEAKDDVSNAFDGITYEKGAAVIRMFETWTGERQFRAGVTAYLSATLSATRPPTTSSSPSPRRASRSSPPPSRPSSISRAFRRFRWN